MSTEKCADCKRGTVRGKHCLREALYQELLQIRASGIDELNNTLLAALGEIDTILKRAETWGRGRVSVSEASEASIALEQVASEVSSVAVANEGSVERSVANEADLLDASGEIRSEVEWEEGGGGGGGRLTVDQKRSTTAVAVVPTVTASGSGNVLEDGYYCCACLQNVDHRDICPLCNPSDDEYDIGDSDGGDDDNEEDTANIEE